MSLKLKPLQAVTNAPVEYDYGWMKTVIDNFAVDEKGRVCRLVENDDEWHFTQQILRYGSGLNLSITEQSGLDTYTENGWLKLTPENEVHIYRIKVDMKPTLDWPREERRELLTEFLAPMKLDRSPITYETGHDFTYYFTCRGADAFRALRDALASFKINGNDWEEIAPFQWR